MSFNVEFTASNKADAFAALSPVRPEKFYLPLAVTDFLLSAVSGIKSDTVPVYVKAFGHLASGQDFEVSTATIEVRPMRLWTPPT